MANAQKLLENKYPNKEAKEINLTELLYDKKENEFNFDEEGELKIENFPNLIEIKIDKVGEDYIEFAKVTKITIANCPELEKIDVNTFVENKELEITNCPNLTELDCSYNQLENLDLSKTNTLKKLDCNSNQLTNLSTKY